MTNENEIYFNYLDDLRDSGETNMFGSPAYLVDFLLSILGTILFIAVIYQY